MEKKSIHKLEAVTGLFIVEIFIFSVNAALMLSQWFNWDRQSTLIAGMLFVALISALCFSSYIFKAVGSILVSLLWGFFAFEFTELLPQGAVNRWGAFWLVFTISLVLHKTFLLGKKKRIRL